MTALTAALRRMVITLRTSVLESCQCNDGNLTSESETYAILTTEDHKHKKTFSSFPYVLSCVRNPEYVTVVVQSDSLSRNSYSFVAIWNGII